MTLRVKSLAELPAELVRANPGLVNPAAAGRRGPANAAPTTGVLAAEPRRKYGNTKVELDGHTFDSGAEAKRYTQLLNMQACGLIEKLRVHVSYALHVNGVRIGELLVDFDYRDLRVDKRGVLTVEDVKSPFTVTTIYRWKAKHLQAEYGLEIKEIERAYRKSKAKRGVG